MKKLSALVTYWFFSFAVSASSVLCLSTGFDLPANIMIVLAVTVCTSAAFTLLAATKHPVLSVGAGVLTYAALEALFRQRLIDSIYCVVLSAAQRISSLDLSAAPASDATLALLLLAGLISAITALCVSRRSTLILVLIAALLPAVLCVIMPDSLPDAYAFISLVIVLVLLVMTCYHTDKNIGKAVLMLCAPLLSLMLVLLLLIPPASYTPPKFADKVKHSFTSVLDSLLFPGTTGGDDSIHVLESDELFISETVELSKAGPRRLSDSAVMSIYSTQTGQTYLRGMAYGDYVNNSWLPVSAGKYSRISPGFEPLTQASGLESDYAAVKQYQNSNCIYTPYYLSRLPSQGTVYADSYIVNNDSLRSYTLTFSAKPSYDNGSDKNGIYEDYVNQNYLSVPVPIKEYVMDNIWDGFFDSMTTEQKCSTVTDYLANIAVYDLDTPCAPEGTDFVLWFLQNEKRGYCVHFASAATLMLRSLGIPARYVSGFCCTTVTDQWRNVAEKNAHAWVEYYVPGCGWLPLEATPPRFIEHTVTEEAVTAPSEPVDAADGDGSEAYDIPSYITVSEAEIALHESDDTESPSDNAGHAKASPVIFIFAAAFLLICAVLMIRVVIIALRQRAITRGLSNSRALAMWKYITKLSKACGVESDKKCESIALKARFSQHEINDAELAQLGDVIDDLRNELMQENIFYRFIYRFILAIL